MARSPSGRLRCQGEGLTRTFQITSSFWSNGCSPAGTCARGASAERRLCTVDDCLPTARVKTLQFWLLQDILPTTVAVVFAAGGFGPGQTEWYHDLVEADIVVATVKDMKLTSPPAPEDVDFDKLKVT